MQETQDSPGRRSTKLASDSSALNIEYGCPQLTAPPCVPCFALSEVRCSAQTKVLPGVEVAGVMTE